MFGRWRRCVTGVSAECDKRPGAIRIAGLIGERRCDGNADTGVHNNADAVRLERGERRDADRDTRA